MSYEKELKKLKISNGYFNNSLAWQGIKEMERLHEKYVEGSRK